MNRRLIAVKSEPRRKRVGGAELVVPPFELDDLPPGGMFGSFQGIAALKFATQRGIVYALLHDLPMADLRKFLDVQREQAEAQFGRGYASRPAWWESDLR